MTNKCKPKSHKTHHPTQTDRIVRTTNTHKKTITRAILTNKAKTLSQAISKNHRMSQIMITSTTPTENRTKKNTIVSTSKGAKNSNRAMTNLPISTISSLNIKMKAIIE